MPRASRRLNRARAPLGCFACAKGRFLNAKNELSGDEIDIVVDNLCAHNTNPTNCPAVPGEKNKSKNQENHLDFVSLPKGVHNHMFAFTPAPCSSALTKGYLKLGEDTCKRDMKH